MWPGLKTWARQSDFSLSNVTLEIRNGGPHSKEWILRGLEEELGLAIRQDHEQVGRDQERAWDRLGKSE